MHIVIDNLVVNYQTYKSKNPNSEKNIILLHGWGCDLHIWDSIVNDLTFDANVIAIDLPGFGASETPKTVWGVTDYANLIYFFINKLVLKNVTLVAHSFGGRIAIKFAALFKGQINKLILVAPAGLIEKNGIKNFCYKIIAKIGNLIFSLPFINKYHQLMRHKFYKAIGATDYLYSGLLKETFLNIVSEDLTLDAKKIINPTMIIWGKLDKDISFKKVSKLQTLIKDSKLNILAHTGHFPWLEKKEEFISLVKLFLL